MIVPDNEQHKEASIRHSSVVGKMVSTILINWSARVRTPSPVSHTFKGPVAFAMLTMAKTKGTAIDGLFVQCGPSPAIPSTQGRRSPLSPVLSSFSDSHSCR